MRKQTASATRKHRKAQSPKQSGLIARAKTAPESATSKCALDNRSHRTLCASPAGDSVALRVDAPTLRPDELAHNINFR